MHQFSLLRSMLHQKTNTGKIFTCNVKTELLSLSVQMQNSPEWVTSGKLNRINLCFHNDSQVIWIFASIKTANTNSWSSVHTVLNDNTLSVPSIFFMPILFLSVSLILLCVSILFCTAVVRLWCNCTEIMALWHVSKTFPGYWSAGSVNRQCKTIRTTKAKRTRGWC